jgi:YidC/Oxa1 family membrane protein insertase
MNSFFRFTITFLIIYFALMFLFPPEKKEDETKKDDVSIVFQDEKVTEGNLVVITVANNTETPISLGNGNPPEHLLIQRYENGEWKSIVSERGDSEEVIVDPKTKKEFSFPEKNTEYFGTEGKYRVEVVQGERRFFADFSVNPPGIFKTLWRVLFWKPVYNALIFLLDLGNHSLGVSVILLTLIVKFLLLVPTQKAMKSQRKMQKLQPELAAIRSKHKNDQQKIATESMALWKKHGVNPFSSLLPILMQFPILIALYYAVSIGLFPYNSYFLYGPLKDFDFYSVNTNFLGVMPLDIMPSQMVSLFWLPVLVAFLQYAVMKLSFAKAAKQKKSVPQKDSPEKSFDFASEMEKMNKVFIYVFPLMIGFFTAVTPSAVGLYWAVSTVFALGQQYIVNKEV